MRRHTWCCCRSLVRLFWVVLTVAAGGGAIFGMIGPDAWALPLYTARSGRTCDNCHSDPTGWKNPALPLRNCTLSCNGCHVNPTGGGLRTVSGRFYGQTTLPALFATHRDYKDWSRHVVRFLGRLEKKRRNRLPETAWGTPAGGSAKLAWDQRRYAGLNADPMLSLGLDLRFAFWFADGLRVFPMQADLHAAFRPVAHFTTYLSAGALARSQGFEGTFDGRVPVGVKDAFVLVHQLPLMGYFRLGRFLPIFGTNIDDHTSPVRRDFELDLGLMESRVFGAEIGLTPNYPYFHLAIFRPGHRDMLWADNTNREQQPNLAGEDGWGLSASLGWRDLGWQAGASVLIRRRELDTGGDTESVSVQWGVNPWFYFDWLPITYMGELAFGRRQRDYSNTHAWHIALYQELSYLPFNGVKLHLKHDYSDLDAEVKDDHYNRLTAGGDLILLPGLSFRGEVRLRFGADKKAGADTLVYVRGWL